MQYKEPQSQEEIAAELGVKSRQLRSEIGKWLSPLQEVGYACVRNGNELYYMDYNGNFVPNSLWFPTEIVCRGLARFPKVSGDQVKSPC